MSLVSTRSLAGTMAALLLSGGLAFGQANLEVGQLPQSGGGFIYQLTGFNSVTLTAPDGSVFPRSSVVKRNFTSFNDLGATLFGDWTATEPSLSGDGAWWKFHVDPFTLSIAPETPVITSPLSGSTVSPDFVVKWAFPGGTNPSQGTFVRSNLGLQTVSVTLGVDGLHSARVVEKLTRPGPIPMDINAIGFANLPDPPITDRSSSLVGQPIFTNLKFASYSETATYNVVPEPTSAALVAFAAMVFGCRDRI